MISKEMPHHKTQNIQMTIPVCNVTLVQSAKTAKDFKDWKKLQVVRCFKLTGDQNTRHHLLQWNCSAVNPQRKVYMQDIPQAFETENSILQSWRAKLPLLSEIIC